MLAYLIIKREKMAKIIYKIIFTVVVAASFHIGAEENSILDEESKRVLERSHRIATQFYTLEIGEEIKEITADILMSNETKETIKQTILTTGRRFFLFTYPSDGFQVKGYISFVPDPTGKPLLILLRGGNRIFGLMNPATDLSCIKDYTVIATTYRGGVSEGTDQFGGEEVNDVQNLIRYVPVLEQKLGVSIQSKEVYLLGGSRGGMEMFLALGRSSALQHYITKAVSLSGLLDMQECIRSREDMKSMFIKDFGLVPGDNDEEWISARDPILTVPNIRRDLPILIIQGTSDNRVTLDEGYHMVEKLEANGNHVDYMEVSEGDHCLGNHPNRVELITEWLERVDLRP